MAGFSASKVGRSAASLLCSSAVADIRLLKPDLEDCPKILYAMRQSLKCSQTCGRCSRDDESQSRVVSDQWYRCHLPFMSQDIDL